MLFSEIVRIFAAWFLILNIMADYKKLFKRENFLKSMRIHKERIRAREAELQQQWKDMQNELEKEKLVTT